MWTDGQMGEDAHGSKVTPGSWLEMSAAEHWKPDEVAGEVKCLGGHCLWAGVEVSWAPDYLGAQGSLDGSWVPQRGSCSGLGSEWRPLPGTPWSCCGPVVGSLRPCGWPTGVVTPRGRSRMVLPGGPGAAVGSRGCVCPWVLQGLQPSEVPSREVFLGLCRSFPPPALKRV